MSPHPTGRGLFPAIAGLLSALLAAGPASARPRSWFVPDVISTSTGRPKLVVLVAPTPGGEVAAGRLLRAAGEAVISSGRYEMVDLFDALDPIGASTRRERAAEARAAIRAARIAFNQLDTGKALAEADRALAALAEADPAAHAKDLTDAWLLKIASLAADGDNKSAQTETERLLAVNPSAEFSPNFFGPDRIAAAEKARRSAQSGTARLDIRANVPAAEIHVDGVFRGFAPVTVEALAPGEHFVIARAPGYAVLHEQTWPGGLELELRETEGAATLREALQGVGAEDTREAAARAFGLALGAAEVLVLRVSPDGADLTIAGQRIDVSGERRYPERQEITRASRLEELAARFVPAVLDAEELRPPAPIAQPEPLAPVAPPPAGPSGRRIGGWVLIGTAVVAAGAGAVLGLQASQRSTELHRLPQVDPASDGVLGSARTFALLADLSFVVSVLAGGTGGYLAFSAEPDPAAPPPSPRTTKGGSR